MAYIGNAPYQGSVAGTNIVDGTIDTPDLKDGSVTGVKLETIAGLTSGNYGTASAIPAITLDTKGRVTAISTNAVSIPSGSISVTGGDITMSGTTGTAITNATLANSGAAAGTYGSASAIPQITVDAKGRITSVTSVNISSLGDTVIQSSGTSAALRITQTGTGNALLVEDSANPDSTPVVIDNAGSVGIGATPSGIESLVVSRNISGAVTSYGINNNGVVQSDVTTAAYYFVTSGQTAAASFTLPNLMHYRAAQGTFGSGSTVTNQYGFIAAGNLTDATNNYGFYSDIASGSGRWNFYANGTAANYFGGNVTIVGSLTVTDPVVQQSDIGTGANEIPLNQYLGANAYVDTETPALNIGTGITTGTGTICKANGGLSGGIYRITILIDLTGLNSGGTAGDIIGVNGTALPCYIAQLPAMTVLGGRMTCLETPAGGDTDIDLYVATEATGIEDQAVSALTETQIINAGAQTLGTVTYFSADPVTNGYLYLVGQGVANATYTAGRFLIEIFGVQ